MERERPKRSRSGGKPRATQARRRVTASRTMRATGGERIEQQLIEIADPLGIATGALDQHCLGEDPALVLQALVDDECAG